MIGYRGSGKSTVAPLIAQALGWKTVDTDDLTEQSTGQTISQIFSDAGEDKFRELERTAVKQATSQRHTVVSFGGGAPTFAANRGLIRRNGMVVYLKGSWETLWERIASDESDGPQRPDLTDQGGGDEVRALVKHRGPVYEACADYTIAIDNNSPEEIAARIVQWFNSDDKKAR